MNVAPRNRVLFALVLVAMIAGLLGGFVSEAPNRLISGQPLALWQVASPRALLADTLLGAMLLAATFLPATRAIHLAALFTAGALLLLLILEAGEAASTLMAAARPATRVSLGLAFWAAVFCLGMAMLDALQRLNAGPTMRLLAVAGLAIPLAAMTVAGTLDQLSIMREYTSRQAVFAAELERHGILVLASVGAALAIGVPLGILAARKPAAGGAIFGTLNLLQTIPSVALFGLLIAPLSALALAVPALGALGIGGIGPAPAIVALVLYSLLPVVRNTQAGIVGVDPAIIDAALGVGFTKAQIFWRIELPLGMPIFVAGLRIVLVQTIGLAAVAALIGAGGLGTFVFQGIGQYATDLVLLGAIPIILLALAVDFILTIVALILRG